MGYTPYQTTVLVPAHNPLTFDELTARFRTRVKPGSSFHPELVVESDRIVLKRENWTLRVHWDEQPWVLEESQEIARRFAATRQDADRIASCNRRITSAGDPDPDMKYFNDYVLVLEIFETLSDVFKFDPYEGKFLTEY